MLGRGAAIDGETRIRYNFSANYPVDTTKTSDSTGELPIMEARAPGVEVTPVMIEAGAEVLWKSGAVEHPMMDADRELIRRIFLAMIEAASSSVLR